MQSLNKNNYYEILEISPTATQDEIKKAFRKLAKRYHPDINPEDPNANAKMQKITAAYEVLSDVEKRKEYDRQHSVESHFESSKSYYSYNQSKEESERDFEDWSIHLLKNYRMYNGKDSELEKLYKAKEILFQLKHSNPISIYSESEEPQTKKGLIKRVLRKAK